ncbi:LacI family DNA-binding transcriptional regulator [Rhizobium sp. 60-20]|uniref:LacI family DNA-binding transcriptional regulator n=1 Tax=Rhizobium sp. 60-20 TaxID=1895819 RepID=UPI00092B3CF8|nr:LacI family DNA-binding transcriptional regulator [Rhizobium sp. 60-20]OJY79663.1 MAG: LacI family transcriptional regulator [Rhizobium sp. 60-20]
MATIKDVAKRAGVAISTASAAINRSAPVSDEVIAKVEAAVRDIGYVPHEGARSLRMGRSRLIGLILPDITNPHFAKVAKVVESACLTAGYMVAVYSTGEDHAREQQILTMMRMQRVEGLIIIPTRSDAAHGARIVDQIHVPTILLDSFVEGLPYDVVKLDNIAAGRIATEHLIGLGHRRIAVTVGRDNIVTGEHRLEGYRQALAAHGLSVERDLLLDGRFDQSVAHDSVLARMQEHDPPTAIFALSNMMTLGTLNALHELRLSVPHDVSVISIDDFDFANIMNPPPTVVAAPVMEMAQAAISALLDEIDRKHVPSGLQTVFEPRLIVRKSCASRLTAATSL